MILDPGDEIDRAIDEVLSSMVAGKPRVTACSVRAAIAEKRPKRLSSLPMWLATAAVVLVGLTLALTSRTPVISRPERAGSAGEVFDPRPARPAPGAEPIHDASIPIRRAAKSPVADTGEDAGWEGLPRLAITAIDLPEPLSTMRLEPDVIQIPLIEIAPLFVSGLSIEQEHDQSRSLPK